MGIKSFIYLHFFWKIMKERGLVGFFESFLDREPLFINKKVLQSNYNPDVIFHRDDQINQVANILAPALRLEKVSNLFIYGKTGTGKTLTVQHTTENMIKIAKDRTINLDILYVNCKLKKSADTEYRLIAQLARELGKSIPPTGLPTEESYKIFFDTIEEKNSYIIIILDEIDQLINKAGDEILYNFTRMNSQLQKSQISIVGISNDLTFVDNIDPRIKSSLSEEEIIFPPYNALQIKDILYQRSKVAFKDSVIEQGVIEKCAAYAAKDHGDARRALELLRVAGEIAERLNSERIDIEHLDKAEEMIERDRIIDIISTQPEQFQATLYSILSVSPQRKDKIFTGDIYNLYKKLCSQTKLRPLTQRRVSDIIAELDMLGIINAKVISKGRYGRTREITLNLQPHLEGQIKKIIEKDLGL